MLSNFAELKISNHYCLCIWQNMVLSKYLTPKLQDILILLVWIFLWWRIQEIFRNSYLLVFLSASCSWTKELLLVLSQLGLGESEGELAISFRNEIPPKTLTRT